MKRLLVVLAAAMTFGPVAVIIGCSDKNAFDPENNPGEGPSGLVVSNIVSTAQFSGSLQNATSAVGGAIAYISAVPGTFPGIDSALIRNETAAGAVQRISASNGGFDPVGVQANQGDVLSLTPFFPGGAGSPVSFKVPARRRPAVVRTNPSRGRTDVALNIQISVVFTEPIDASTFTNANVALLRDGARVQVTIKLSADRLSAELVPAATLEPAATYSLEIAGVRDLDGEAMEGEYVGTFTTSQSSVISTLAFVSDRDGQPHIYLANSDGTGVRRLTNGTGPEYAPTWSPDGQMLAFNSGDNETNIIKRDGTGLRKLATGGGWPAWSPSSNQLLVVNAAGDGLRILNLDGSVASEFVIDLPFGERAKPRGQRWSPDGQQITFTTFLDGPDMDRAYTVPVNGVGATPVLFGSNVIWYECAPVWSPNGKQVALLTGLYGFAVVDAGTGSPRTVIEAPPRTFCGDGGGFPDARTKSSSRLDWSFDGRQLAVTMGDGDALSIKVVDVASGAVQAVIPDAYDPAWQR